MKALLSAASELRKKQVLHQRGRVLRREQTPAEAKLWQLLRGRALGGFKFRRQFPVQRYVIIANGKLTRAMFSRM